MYVLHAYWLCNSTDSTNLFQVLRGLDLQTGFFTFGQMKAATDNFDAANKIGEGGFGVVYKVPAVHGFSLPFYLFPFWFMVFRNMCYVMNI